LRQCLYLIGYETVGFRTLMENLKAWLGLWPFVFPDEEFHWHVVMLTEDEYKTYRDYWNPRGTPDWSRIPPTFHPSRKDFTSGRNMAGVMSHALGCDLGQADYNTIHYDQAYHCGYSGAKLAGNCTQLNGGDSGLCTSTPCVRCRACASRFTGMRTNIRQIQAEYDWFKRTFNRPYKCWPYADTDKQMAAVGGYDYDDYPLRYWTWEHDLSWYAALPLKNPGGKVHIIFDRVIGGDGIPTDVFTAQHPDYVFDPVEMSLKDRGFLHVPEVAVRGEYVSAVALGPSGEGISGVTVFRNGSSLGTTGPNGKFGFIA